MAPKKTNRMGPARTKPKRNRMGESRPPSSTPLKPNARVGPNKRAQAVLRTAEKPKTIIKSQIDSIRGSNATIAQPGVGINIDKATRQVRGQPSSSELSFLRTTGRSMDSNIERRKRRWGGGGSVEELKKRPTVHSLQKDRIRGAAVQHGLGRQLQDVRPGHEVTSSAASPARGRVYERRTNGVLKPYDKSNERWFAPAKATKLNTDTWKNYQHDGSGKTVKFNPENLKSPLRALAQIPLSQVAKKLPGGKLTQAALMINDASKHFTGKSLPDHERKRQKDKNDQLNKIKKNLFGK